MQSLTIYLYLALEQISFKLTNSISLPLSQASVAIASKLSAIAKKQKQNKGSPYTQYFFN